MIYGDKMMRNVYRFRGILLAALMSLSIVGCNKQAIDDVEYDLGESVEDNTSSSNTSNKSQNGQLLAERLGVDDKLTYKEEFPLGRTKIVLDFNSDPQEIYQIPSYQADSAVYDAAKEDEIVKNLFGDTAKRIDVDIDEYLGSKDSEGSLRSEKDVFHVYEGEYEGNDFILYYAYQEYNNTIDISMRPVDVGSFIDDPKKQYIYHISANPSFCSYFVEDEIGIGGNVNLSEDVISDLTPIDNISEVSLELNDIPNRYSASDDQLFDIASNFFRHTLGLDIMDESICVNLQNDFYVEGSEESGELEGSKFSEREELYFSDSKEFGDAIDKKDNLVKDGYSVSITSKIGEMNSTINGLYADDNYGWISITSKGIAGFEYHYGYTIGEMITEDVQMLKFDGIMESLKNAITEYMDPEELKRSEITFNECYLEYYGLSSPDKKGEYTFIPAWVFWGLDPQGKYSMVILNAVDGSFITMINE